MFTLKSIHTLNLPTCTSQSLMFTIYNCKYFSAPNHRYKTITNAKWHEIIGSLKGELPNICCLLDLVITIPASSADAERGFSRLKLLKTNQRTRLHDDSVSDQLMVMLNTYCIEEFDPMPAIHLWNSSGVRSRRFEQPGYGQLEESSSS